MQARQFVDLPPENPWSERLRRLIQTLWMGWPTKRQFDTGLCDRVKELRKARNWTQEQMANALGVTPSAYEKYEARTPMPSYLIPRFAQLVGFTIAYVMTGEQESGPSTPMPGRRRGRHGKQINQTNRRLDC